ncbi:hypothetical protein CEQ90_02430 [Lewinellaceae bacterium SD302]|nr:hypothetical protein CEQ90_02430 [Lewinellaceae bacterium SD302]
MQKRLLFFLFLTLCWSAATAQNGMIGAGFANGWNYPADVVAMQPSLGGSFIYTSQPSADGDNFFRFVNTNNDNQYGPFDCIDFDWTGNQGTSYNDMGICDPFGAFFLNAMSTDHNYVFKTRFEDNDDFLYFVVEGDVFDFIPGQTAQDPMPDAMGRVNPDADVTVSTVAAFSAGQTAYLRYTTDDFVSSTVVEMVDLFGISVYDAVIPAQPAGTTVKYYLFTSGTGSAAPAADGSDADYKTITFETNGGNNFSYTTDAALPVTYHNFEGKREANGEVLLNWTTASEANASHFVVECSDDNGRSWMRRGQVTATNKITGSAYDFLDAQAPKSSLQYRLRQHDFDGLQELSSIVTVKAALSGQTNSRAGLPMVKLFPNPVSDFLSIQLDTPIETQIIITDSHGQEQLRWQTSNGSTRLDTRQLPAGVYLLRLYQDGQLGEARKFVKL